MISSGFPAATATAARVFIREIPRWCPVRREVYRLQSDMTDRLHIVPGKGK
jgi:hypothetical protein